MSDGEIPVGAGSAPGGVTSNDDTTTGVDNASAASISGPGRHPGRIVEGSTETGAPAPVTDDADEAAEPDEATGAEQVDDTEQTDDAVEADGPAHPVLRELADGFPHAVWSVSHGQDVVRLPAEGFAEFGRAAHAAGFEVCVDVTAVDWYRTRRPRFDVVANLLSHAHVLRLRMIAEVGEDDPTVPSLTPIWPGANFAEREAYDMFGIVFDGHPDLTRILMPDDWVGYPLRKDFSVGAVPVQFKESHKVT